MTALQYMKTFFYINNMKHIKALDVYNNKALTTSVTRVN